VQMDGAYMKEMNLKGECAHYNLKLGGRTVRTMEYDECMRGEAVPEMGTLK